MNPVWLSTKLAGKVSDPVWGGGLRRDRRPSWLGWAPAIPT